MEGIRHHTKVSLLIDKFEGLGFMSYTHTNIIKLIACKAFQSCHNRSSACDHEKNKFNLFEFTKSEFHKSIFEYYV